MPNLSIKDVPEALAQTLRERAARNHRSLQGELMAILEATCRAEAAAPSTGATRLAAEESAPALAYAAKPADSPVQSTAGGDLLAELDTIVAGSQWGSAPLLTRDQIHDRRLMRELEFIDRATDPVTPQT